MRGRAHCEPEPIGTHWTLPLGVLLLHAKQMRLVNRMRPGCWEGGSDVMHLLLLALQLRRVLHVMHVQLVRRVRAVAGRHCRVCCLRLERESGNGRQHEARGNSKRRAE